MDYALTVGGVQSLQQLVEVLSRDCRSERSHLAQFEPPGAARQHLHDQKGPLGANCAKVVNGDDVGMAQPGQ